MRRRSLGILVAVAATSWCLLSGSPPAHAANVPVKMSWTVGEYKLGDTEYNITYRVAQLGEHLIAHALGHALKIAGYQHGSSTCRVPPIGRALPKPLQCSARDVSSSWQRTPAVVNSRLVTESLPDQLCRPMRSISFKSEP